MAVHGALAEGGVGGGLHILDGVGAKEDDAELQRHARVLGDGGLAPHMVVHGEEDGAVRGRDVGQALVGVAQGQAGGALRLAAGGQRCGEARRVGRAKHVDVEVDLRAVGRVHAGERLVPLHDELDAGTGGHEDGQVAVAAAPVVQVVALGRVRGHAVGGAHVAVGGADAVVAHVAGGGEVRHAGGDGRGRLAGDDAVLVHRLAEVDDVVDDDGAALVAQAADPLCEAGLAAEGGVEGDGGAGRHVVHQLGHARALVGAGDVVAHDLHLRGQVAGALGQAVDQHAGQAGGGGGGAVARASRVGEAVAEDADLLAEAGDAGVDGGLAVHGAVGAAVAGAARVGAGLLGGEDHGHLGHGGDGLERGEVGDERRGAAVGGEGVADGHAGHGDLLQHAVVEAGEDDLHQHGVVLLGAHEPARRRCGRQRHAGGGHLAAQFVQPDADLLRAGCAAVGGHLAAGGLRAAGDGQQGQDRGEKCCAETKSGAMHRVLPRCGVDAAGPRRGKGLPFGGRFGARPPGSCLATLCPGFGRGSCRSGKVGFPPRQARREPRGHDVCA